jgi:thiaminase/transcriptional activator TenA
VAGLESAADGAGEPDEAAFAEVVAAEIAFWDMALA